MKVNSGESHLRVTRTGDGRMSLLLNGVDVSNLTAGIDLVMNPRGETPMALVYLVPQALEFDGEIKVEFASIEAFQLLHNLVVMYESETCHWCNSTLPYHQVECVFAQAEAFVKRPYRGNGNGS